MPIGIGGLCRGVVEEEPKSVAKALESSRSGGSIRFGKSEFNPFKNCSRHLHATCLRSRVRSELATAEETKGSSPTSSRWALETLATRARLDDGRRLSGERFGSCGSIGEEIVQTI